MKCSITILALFILASCSSYSDNGDIVDKDRLIGKFAFQTWGHDTIDVNSDGTYLHCTTDGGRQLRNSGTWTYDSIRGRMIFADFSFLN